MSFLNHSCMKDIDISYFPHGSCSDVSHHTQRRRPSIIQMILFTSVISGKSFILNPSHIILSYFVCTCRLFPNASVKALTLRHWMTQRGHVAPEIHQRAKLNYWSMFVSALTFNMFCSCLVLLVLCFRAE